MEKSRMEFIRFDAADVIKTSVTPVEGHTYIFKYLGNDDPRWQLPLIPSVRVSVDGGKYYNPLQLDGVILFIQDKNGEYRPLRELDIRYTSDELATDFGIKNGEEYQFRLITEGQWINYGCFYKQ